MVRLHFRSDANVSCYALYAVASGNDTSASNAQRCDCTLGPGSACPVGGVMVEIRTLQVPQRQSVRIRIPEGWPVAFAFDPVTGRLVSVPLDNPSTPLNQVRMDAQIDASRTLRTVVSGAGRPTVCAPPGSTMPEVAC
jgi:hypothetical protein